MKVRKYLFLALTLIIVFFACINGDFLMINTGDYYRATHSFIDPIKSFDHRIGELYPLKDDLKIIAEYSYKSSYSYIVNIYAYLISFATEEFNLRHYFILMTTLYIFSLYKLQKKLYNKSLVVYFLFSLLLISSSNLGFFKSFYQEQLLLIFLPLLGIYLDKNNNGSLFFAFILMTLIATLKSQFFYVPLLAILYYSIFNREKLGLKLILMAISLGISYGFVYASKGTVEYNKYHAAYFGVYNYLKENSLYIDKDIDDQCIGIDAWGNRFDLDKGIGSSAEDGGRCFEKHKEIGFSDSLKSYVKNPLILIKLPYDKTVRAQFTEIYFHVSKNLLLLVNDNSLLGKVAVIKDYLFNEIRFSALLLVMLASLVLYKKTYSGLLFFISAFGISQFYISFLAEGYRDLAKHLFPMNFSFDLLLFIIAILLARYIDPLNFCSGIIPRGKCHEYRND